MGDEIFWIDGGGLASDRVHDAEHVLGAMIDFAHEEVLFFLALLAFGNVRNGADDTHRPLFAPGAIEICKPESLSPADLAVSPPKPELGRGPVRIDGIESRLERRQNSFHVVRMDQLYDLFKSRPVLSNIENFHRARIPRECALERIVLPPPEPGCVHGKLQTIFARL